MSASTSSQIPPLPSRRAQLLGLPNEILTKIADQLIGQQIAEIKQSVHCLQNISRDLEHVVFDRDGYPRDSQQLYRDTNESCLNVRLTCKRLAGIIGQRKVGVWEHYTRTMEKYGEAMFIWDTFMNWTLPKVMEM